MSDDLAELMVESARPINFGRKYSEEEEPFVAAAPEPTEEPILQMNVEVAELTKTVHDATKFAAGAVVVVVAAVILWRVLYLYERVLLLRSHQDQDTNTTFVDVRCKKLASSRSKK